MATKPAALSDKQLMQIQSLEKEINAVLVASESTDAADSASKMHSAPKSGERTGDTQLTGGRSLDNVRAAAEELSHPYARLNRKQLERLYQIENDLSCLVLAYRQSG